MTMKYYIIKKRTAVSAEKRFFMKKQIYSLLAAGTLLAAAMSGCKAEESPSVSNTDTSTADYGELADYEGHWVDVNSDATLDFEGNTMTFYDGYETRTFTVRKEDIYIKNADDNYGEFWSMSALCITSDGALEGREMVLDAKGHTFRFVREADLSKEKEIADNSKDLPKVIESRDLESFSFSFDLGESRYDVTNEKWPNGQYSFNIEKEDGAYIMSFDISGDSYIICQYSEEVSKEYVEGFLDLLNEIHVPEYNGYNLSNKEDFTIWYFYARFASREKLELQSEGRPALECPFSISAILEYADQQVHIEEMWP